MLLCVRDLLHALNDEYFRLKSVLKYIGSIEFNQNSLIQSNRSKNQIDYIVNRTLAFDGVCERAIVRSPIFILSRVLLYVYLMVVNTPLCYLQVAR